MGRVAGCLTLLLAAAAAAAQPAPARRAELVELVRQDCGACHGLTLKGGLGPSLEPGAMADKDAEYLSFVILHGRRGTPMPPWRGHLTESEARWIAETLKQGLPK
jgi:cytochrome c55X